MNAELTRILHEGGHSLVVAHGDEIRTYDGRGVSDLLRLLDEDDAPLRGADIADKVVGKAAAALMIAGGVARVHADVVSSSALALFNRSSVHVSCNIVTPYIINRKGTGMCPLELRCMDCSTADECIDRIHAFFDKKR